jgi:hypothetical protein
MINVNNYALFAILHKSVEAIAIHPSEARHESEENILT